MKWIQTLRFLIRERLHRDNVGVDESFEVLKRKADAAESERTWLEHREAETSRKKAKLESELVNLQSEEQQLRKSCGLLETKLEGTRKECIELKTKIESAESERKSLEHDIAALRLHAMLNQQAVITGRPGDSFFVRVDIAAPKEPVLYPEPIKTAKAFSIPDELPPITMSHNEIEWAFSSKSHGRVVVVDSTEAELLSSRIVFVGDVHGDVDVLRRIVEHLFRGREDAILVFLGDLFDRGEKSIEAVRLLFWTARRFPGQVLWVAGNHDVGLSYDDNAEKFVSSVQPAEFTEWLNANPAAKEEGRLLINTIADLPVACVIGDVWASHGGTPQSDVSEDFTSFDKMTDEMIEDCFWSHMKDVPKKLPNRTHKGAEVGFEDARLFFNTIMTKENIKIRHVVCAHEHSFRDGIGCVQYSKCFKPDELSCQCIFSFYDKGHDVEPCYLEYQSGKIPVPHTI